jgi:dolichol-phosphate mannosyltransferase
LKVIKSPIAIATGLLLALRLTSAFLVELTPQEAYYWNYAMHPALSYFEHPPAVAWVIRGGCWLFGKSELSVRFGGLVLTVLSTWLLYALGKLWFNKKAGLWAAFLFQVVPLFFVYGILITPDVPLIFFWLLTLYLISVAVREERRGLWYWAGVALGLSLLSKYSAVFLLPSTFLFLLFDRRYRFWLLRVEPYVALIIALILFTPVILWNSEHQWASFAFQVGDRLVQETKNPLRHFGEFVLIQLGVTSPLFLVALLLLRAVPLSLPNKERRAAWRFALLFAAPLLISFLAYSARSAVKANWTLPGYTSLLVAAYPAYRYLRLGSGARMKTAARYFLTFWLSTLPLIYCVAVYHSIVPLPHVKAHHWTTGWRELGRIVGQEARSFESESNQKVFLLGMDTHYIAAALSFYADEGYPVFSQNLIGRTALAFAYWKPIINLVGLNALAVDIDKPRLMTLRRYFSRVDEPRRVPVMQGGRIVYYAYLIKCYGYKGIGS